MTGMKILLILLLTVAINAGTIKLNNTLSDPLANENFYDFFIRFCSQKEFQLSRVKISQWRYKEFFAEKEYIVHISVKHEKLDNYFGKDFSDKKILSEFVPLEGKKINYRFKKENRSWFLISTESKPVNKDSLNNFICFLYRFSKDSLYQKDHIKYPLKFTYLNLDNDYNDTTEYIKHDKVGNFDYFENDVLLFFDEEDIESSKTNKASVILRGKNNGINSRTFFNFRKNSWQLVEEIDHSM